MLSFPWGGVHRPSLLASCKARRAKGWRATPGGAAGMSGGVATAARSSSARTSPGSGSGGG
eukprot:9689665-Lingulodinium_polyedra.AAC.1